MRKFTTYWAEVRLGLICLQKRVVEVKARMELKESPDKGVFIKDLTINVVKSSTEMERYMTIGTENRLMIRCLC